MSQDALLSDTSSTVGTSDTQRRDMIVTVRWALIVACAYLVLFGEGPGGKVLGPLAVVAYLLSNLMVGRLRPETVDTQQFKVVIALLDSVFIALSLYLAGQLQLELVLLCLGILVLAIAGLRLSVIAGATLAMTGAYVVVVWLAGGESIWRSSMLLRVPFLLCAALVYAWVTEGAHAADGAQSIVKAVVADLGSQTEAIRRCQSVIGDGAENAAARVALDDVAHINQAIQAKLTGALSAPGSEVAVHPAA